MISFKKAAEAEENETVVFAWIVFESKIHRDQVNKAVMADPCLSKMTNPDAMPFDCKRMAYDGFIVIVNH